MAGYSFTLSSTNYKRWRHHRYTSISHFFTRLPRECCAPLMSLSGHLAVAAKIFSGTGTVNSINELGRSSVEVQVVVLLMR